MRLLRLPFASLLKGLKKLLMLLKKEIGYPFDYFACGNQTMHATQIMFRNTAGRTKIKIKKGD